MLSDIDAFHNHVIRTTLKRVRKILTRDQLQQLESQWREAIAEQEQVQHPQDEAAASSSSKPSKRKADPNIAESSSNQNQNANQLRCSDAFSAESELTQKALKEKHNTRAAAAASTSSSGKKKVSPKRKQQHKKPLPPPEEESSSEEDFGGADFQEVKINPNDASANLANALNQLGDDNHNGNSDRSPGGTRIGRNKDLNEIEFSDVEDENESSNTTKEDALLSGRCFGLTFLHFGPNPGTLKLSKK